MKTPVLVRLVCTLVPRSASVALYEQTVVSSARTGTTEGFRALNCTCFGTFQSSAGVLGRHIPALLGAPHCTSIATRTSVCTSYCCCTRGSAQLDFYLVQDRCHFRESEGLSRQILAQNLSSDFGPKSDDLGHQILKPDFVPLDFAISYCTTRPIIFSYRKKKT